MRRRGHHPSYLICMVYRGLKLYMPALLAARGSSIQLNIKVACFGTLSFLFWGDIIHILWPFCGLVFIERGNGEFSVEVAAHMSISGSERTRKNGGGPVKARSHHQRHYHLPRL